MLTQIKKPRPQIVQVFRGALLETSCFFGDTLLISVGSSNTRSVLKGLRMCILAMSKLRSPFEGEDQHRFLKGAKLSPVRLRALNFGLMTRLNVDVKTIFKRVLITASYGYA
jgi:hypothetical protein